MGEPAPDSKTPVYVAFAAVAIGIVIAALGNIKYGSIWGGIVAALGAIPGLFGMWKGIQQETQGTLAAAVVSVLVSLGVAAVLIVLRVIHWVA